MTQPCDIDGCPGTPHYCTSTHYTLKILHISQSEGLWQPCIKQVYWLHFSNSTYLLWVSRSHFGDSQSISNLLIIIIFVTVIYGHWSLMLLLYLFGVTMSQAHTGQWTNKCCVYSNCFFNQLFSHLYPYRVPLPHSLRYNNVEIRPINTSTIFFKCSSERKSYISYSKSWTRLSDFTHSLKLREKECCKPW